MPEERLKTLTIQINQFSIPKETNFIKLAIEFIKISIAKGDETTLRIIQSAIQCDLLMRTSGFQTDAKEIGQRSLILIDTNIVFALMCPMDLAHILSNTAIKLSIEAGYPIYYLPATVLEWLFSQFR